MNGLNIVGMGEYVALNDQVYSTIYDGTIKRFMMTTPQGRVSYSWIDSIGRVIKDSIPNIAPTTYKYDTQGRIVNVAQAGRMASYAYNPQGFLTTNRSD